MVCAIARCPVSLDAEFTNDHKFWWAISGDAISYLASIRSRAIDLIRKLYKSNRIEIVYGFFFSSKEKFNRISIWFSFPTNSLFSTTKDSINLFNKWSNPIKIFTICKLQNKKNLSNKRTLPTFLGMLLKVHIITPSCTTAPTTATKRYARDELFIEMVSFE